MAKRLTIEEVRSKFEEEGYQLLSTEYKNNWTKLKVKCPKDHIYDVTYSDFKQGHRCRKCDVNKRRLTIKEVRAKFEDEGYQLLSTEYNKNTDKLDSICKNNHPYTTTFKSFNKGYRCPKCRNKNRHKELSFTFEYVKSYIEKEGYTLLSKQYINNYTKIEVKCPKGHNYFVRFNNFKQGQRCQKCYDLEKKKKMTFTYDHITNIVEKENFKLLDNYIDNGHKIKLRCPKGHEYTARLHNFQQGTRCPRCSKNHSRAELEIYNFIKEYFSDAVNGDRTILEGKELDIYVPSKGIAIEYCGLYWHSELSGNKDRNYHLDKLNKCQEKGVKLITIFEDEWLFKRDIVISRLKNIFNIGPSNTIFARKCTIKCIDAKTKNEFLNKYHIQGEDRSAIKLGAYYEDNLVSVMTFSKPSIAKGTQSKEGVYELSRFCSSTRVIGIASKLLTYFKRNYEYKEIFSYADKRWSDGNLYQVLGFDFMHDSKPNYWYIEDDKRVHRFNYRKNILEDKLTEFNPEISEWDNMVNNNYDRIHDCGNSVWGLAA